MTHRRMREVWVADLALCALGDTLTSVTAAPASAVPASVPAAAAGDADAHAGDEVTMGPNDEVDSDDASDAYSSGEDEDEPLAEIMDELEPDVEDAVVDSTSDEVSPAADSGEGLGVIAEGKVCPVSGVA